MDLTINNVAVALPENPTISIEKSNPLMNDNPGSFSYPSPVSTRKNQLLLGSPGKLTRVGALPKQNFILTEHGLQILSGEVEYETITEEEIGLILKSGYTEFRAKMAGRKLSEIGFGYESGLPSTSVINDVTAKMADWDRANKDPNGKYTMAPCTLKSEDELIKVPVNQYDYTFGVLKFSGVTNSYLFMMQFYAWFILQKIFESAGYTVIMNNLETSEFKDVTVFSKPFRIRRRPGNPTIYWIDGMKTAENLYYSKLMPDLTVLEFVDRIMVWLCQMPDIDERNKTVHIVFKKTVIDPSSVEYIGFIRELKGWENQEISNQGGFRVGYMDQDNELDTKSDYEIEREIPGILQAPTEEGEIVKASSYDTDWITILEGEELKWRQVGRLKDFVEGNASEEIEFEIRIPEDVQALNGHYIPEIVVEFEAKTGAPKNFTDIVASMYRGIVTIGLNPGIPWLKSDAMPGDPRSLTPAYIFDKCHKEFLRWKTSDARTCLKYIALTLPQVIALSNRKTYIINGVRIVIDKINYELPHRGTVKIEAYTIPPLV